MNTKRIHVKIYDCKNHEGIIMASFKTDGGHRMDTERSAYVPGWMGSLKGKYVDALYHLLEDVDGRCYNDVNPIYCIDNNSKLLYVQTNLLDK